MSVDKVKEIPGQKLPENKIVEAKSESSRD
jgi:hypothetical protein